MCNVMLVANHLLHLLAEKWFDIVLAFAGTMFGYWIAKRHIEHFVSNIVKQMEAKHLDINRNIAFHNAVGLMLAELPNFHLRQSTGFSSGVATALAAFTSWSTAIDPAHTPEKSMELVGKEAYTLAAGLIAKDIGFKEEEPAPNYEWMIGVEGLPAAGWEVEAVPDLSISDWNTGIMVHPYALMKETGRTATSIHYTWKWSTKDVPCGVYVGTVNYTIGGKPVIGNSVGKRLKIFLKRENDGTIRKIFETIPWG